MQWIWHFLQCICDYTLKQGIVNAMAGIFFNGITPMYSGGDNLLYMLLINKESKQLILLSILLMIFIVYQSVLVVYTSLSLCF